MLSRFTKRRPELPDEVPSPPGSADPFERFSRHLPPSLLETSEVTDLLYGRLDDADIAAVHEAMSVEETALWEGAGAVDRKRLTLAYGVYYGVPGVLLKTSLPDQFPPEDVHAMSRGPHVTAGSCAYGDLVMDAMRSAASGFSPGGRGLDFGCSSGRVVRGLAAAYPEVEWHGCDPVPESVKWAQANLPGIRFQVSQPNPPLAYPDAFFELVFAISIWSHFSEPAALRWLEEMRRIIRPGGHLVITTHGYQAVAWLGERQLYEAGALAGVQESLYSTGYWFAPVLNPAADWGIVYEDWGTAFFTPEWLLAHACPAWSTVSFAPGRVEGNQDIYTLQRR